MNDNFNYEVILKKVSRELKVNSKFVTGTVVKITPDVVLVDIGRKEIGVVKLEELSYDPNATTEELVKVGDKLEFVLLPSIDSDKGYVFLSRILAVKVRLSMREEAIRRAEEEAALAQREAQIEAEETRWEAVHHAKEEAQIAKINDASKLESSRADQSEDRSKGKIPEELITQVVEKATKILNDQYTPIVHELERRIIELETEVCYLQKY